MSLSRNNVLDRELINIIRWRPALPARDVHLYKGIAGNNALYHILDFRV